MEAQTSSEIFLADTRCAVALPSSTERLSPEAVSLEEASADVPLAPHSASDRAIHDEYVAAKYRAIEAFLPHRDLLGRIPFLNDLAAARDPLRILTAAPLLTARIDWADLIASACQSKQPAAFLPALFHPECAARPEHLTYVRLFLDAQSTSAILLYATEAALTVQYADALADLYIREAADASPLANKLNSVRRAKILRWLEGRPRAAEHFTARLSEMSPQPCTPALLTVATLLTSIWVSTSVAGPATATESPAIPIISPAWEAKMKDLADFLLQCAKCTDIRAHSDDSLVNSAKVPAIRDALILCALISQLSDIKMASRTEEKTRSSTSSDTEEQDSKTNTGLRTDENVPVAENIIISLLKRWVRPSTVPQSNNKEANTGNSTAEITELQKDRQLLNALARLCLTSPSEFHRFYTLTGHNGDVTTLSESPCCTAYRELESLIFNTQ